MPRKIDIQQQRWEHKYNVNNPMKRGGCLLEN